MIRARAALGSTITLVLAIALGACSSPRERLYLLDDSAETTEAGPPATTVSRAYAGTVVLGPVSIPPELDRPQIMVLEGDQLVMNEQDRWALPLKQAIPRALAVALTQRTPYRFVTLGSAAVEPPLAQMSVDVTRFEVSPTAGALLTAHWVWRSKVDGSSAIEGEALAHADVHAAGYAGVVGGLRRATTALAERLATQLPTPHASVEEGK
jgi:uncharacterized protein